MAQQLFKDFYQVPGMKFDVTKLRNDLTKVLKRKKFDDLNISHFGAISLNQIPGDESSTKGHNIRGVYWTKPDESGKEVSRDIQIDETKYSEIVPEFKNTYFESVYKVLKERFKLGRVRILLKEPRSTLSWHRDPEP